MCYEVKLQQLKGKTSKTEGEKAHHNILDMYTCVSILQLGKAAITATISCLLFFVFYRFSYHFLVTARETVQREKKRVCTAFWHHSVCHKPMVIWGHGRWVSGGWHSPANTPWPGPRSTPGWASLTFESHRNRASKVQQLSLDAIIKD